MLQIGAVQIFHDPMVAGTNDIQEMSKTHDAVSRSKTELWHRSLTHYLPRYFPEVDRRRACCSKGAGRGNRNVVTTDTRRWNLGHKDRSDPPCNLSELLSWTVWKCGRVV